MAENSSSADLKAERDRDIRLPAKMNEFYIEIDPEPDYRHASIAAHEASAILNLGFEFTGVFIPSGNCVANLGRS